MLNELFLLVVYISCDKKHMVVAVVMCLSASSHMLFLVGCFAVSTRPFQIRDYIYCMNGTEAE